MKIKLTGGWGSLLSRLLRMLMRIFILLCCTTVFSLTPKDLFSQSTKITVDKDQQVSVEEVFEMITKQTKYSFMYPSQLFEDYPKVELKKGKIPMDKLINQSLAYGNINIVLTANNGIIIQERGQVVQFTVTGSVTDLEGVPIPGATVLVKGTRRGVSTDFDGKFSISVSDEANVLVFSSMGYESQEITVGDKRLMEVKLKEAVSELDEVVVNAGYYTVSQKESTGNIAAIGGEVLERQAVGNVFQALQGRMAGLSITQTSGVPGGRFEIQIRGQNSIINGNEPLYVIDGIPYMSNAMEGTFSNTSNGGGNPLQAINPADIEKVEVLKDADATAIYGSRGSNGVVLITTKKGSIGEAKVSVNLSKGVSQLNRFWDMLSTPEYLEMRREAFTNDGITPTEANAPDLLLWDQDRFTDWQRDLLGGTAHVTEAQLSLSGGNEQTRFRLGATFREQGSVFPGDFSNRKLSGTMSVQHTSVDKRLELQGSVLYSRDQNVQPYNDPTFLALYSAPNAPDPFTEEGEPYWDSSGWNNPYGQLLQHYDNTQYAFVGNLGVQYRLFDGLHFKLNAGYNRMESEQMGIVPVASRNPAYYATGYSQFGYQNFGSWLLEPQIRYNQAIGRGRLDVLLGSSFQENTSSLKEFGGTGYTDDSFIENLASAPSMGISFFEETNYKYMAVFGRVNYTYDHKYILNLTGRRDGSSRFGPNRRWGNFGAIGAAWLFGEEGWFEDSALSFGKLRASYGTSGNDRINDYGYVDSWTTQYYDYNGATGVYPSRLFNENYSWEVNKKLEIALETDFYEGKLGANVAWYRNRSSNMLVGQPLPLITGFNSIQNNLDAIVQNTGWELELRGVAMETNNFHWDVNAILSIPENKLVAFPNLEASVYANTYIIGQPLNSRYLYNYQGIDQETGFYQFEDVDGDGIISALEDKKYAKKNARRYYGSFQSNLNYKQWQLRFMFDFVNQTGYDYMYDLGAPPGYRRNQPQLTLDRWQQTGDQATVQAYTTGGTGTNQYLLYLESTASITDASYTRLRQVSLSYDIPNSLLDRIKLSQLRLYIEGQNLHTWTKYDGFDPETQSTRILPPLTTWMVGMQLSF